MQLQKAIGSVFVQLNESRGAGWNPVNSRRFDERAGICETFCVSGDFLNAFWRTEKDCLSHEDSGSNP